MRISQAFRALTIGSCGVALGMLAGAPAHAQNWRMATGFADNLYQTQNIQLWTADVDKMSGGKLKIRVSTNSALYKQPEIKRAVETGQIQAGEILLSAYGNEIPLFSADVVPYLITGVDEAWKLYQATKPLVVEQFGKDGLVMLYSVAWPGAGFFSTKPIEKAADLPGNKMRSAAPLTGKWTDRLGMSSIVIHPPELAQAFTTGMVNMMFTSSPLGPQVQAWQFTKYFYDLNAIHGRNAVFVNKAAFDRLSPETKKAVLAASETAEKRGWEMMQTADLDYKKQMRDNGMWVGPIKPEIQKVMEREAKAVAKEWASALPPKAKAAVEPFVNR